MLTRPRRVRRDRAVVDDPPAARVLRLHHPERVLGAQEGAGEVGVDHRLPVGQVDLVERAGRAEQCRRCSPAGQGVPSGPGRGEERGHRRRRGHVGRDGQGRAPRPAGLPARPRRGRLGQRAARRPASATCQPAPSRARAMLRPSPELAPVTTATRMATLFLGKTVLGDDGDRPPAGLDQPDRQRPDQRWPALADAPTTTASARTSSATRRSSCTGRPRGDERDRHAQPPASSSARRRRSAAVSWNVSPCAAMARARGRRGAVKARELLDVDADQAGPLPPRQPGRVRPGPQRGDGIVDPDQDDLGPVGAQFEGSAFFVRHSGIIGTDHWPERSAVTARASRTRKTGGRHGAP